MGELKLTETTPSKNWPAGKRPEWVDERTRLYSGFEIAAAGREWHAILTHFDGARTTAYLTQNGFDLGQHGPAVEAVKGSRACHRKCVRKVFECYDVEVTFS
jgi:hypothetical protein